jgi:hypothetical protein
MKWIEIAKYDAMKKKPDNCVFYVAADVNINRPYATLSPLISTTRIFGHRKVTHYFELPELPKE